jgi:hypothetical protein
MAKPTSALTLDVPVAVGRKSQKLRDQRETFATISRKAGRNETAERTFLLSMANLIRTDPSLPSADRKAGLAELNQRLGGASAEAGVVGLGPLPPVIPQIQAYGVWYNDSYKGAFAHGTSLAFGMSCPTSLDGSAFLPRVLYVLGMNRAGKGLLTFVSYNETTQPQFNLYDSSRPDSWQLGIPWSNLGSYLSTGDYRGWWYQTLSVLNNTLELSPGQWRNEAWLGLPDGVTWDLIYRYDYAATLAEQTGGFIGSWWGPTVMDLDGRPFYNRVGALGAKMSSMNSSGVWDSVQDLSASDCYIKNVSDLTVEFIEPMYAFAVSGRGRYV